MGWSGSTENFIVIDLGITIRTRNSADNKENITSFTVFQDHIYINSRKNNSNCAH